MAEVTQDRADGTGPVWAEDWAPSLDAPGAFDTDATASVEPAENPGWAPVLPPALPACPPLAMVDGTRRVELRLWRRHPVTGARVPGLAGAYAVGAVCHAPGVAPLVCGERVGRVAIWGGGLTGGLGSPGGLQWHGVSTPGTDPDDPLLLLQHLMREAEGDLADELARLGWSVMVDGPLNHLRSQHHPVAGYVKTHRRLLLPAEQHEVVPSLRVGERSALWCVGGDRYTCYLRVGRPRPGADAWGGVVRLEFLALFGLDRAVAQADLLAGALPRFAGVHHRDPRAPQNLTPVKALEGRLARALGSRAVAAGIARDLVRATQPSAPTGSRP